VTSTTHPKRKSSNKTSPKVSQTNAYDAKLSSASRIGSRRNNINLVRHLVPLSLVAVVGICFLVSIVYSILSGKFFCANNKSCAQSLTLRVENDAVAIFNNKRIVPPNISLSQNVSRSSVLGQTDIAGQKHIYVDLAKQTLSAYQGETLFMQAYVSTGKWFPTPTGEYTIWVKLRSTRMSGGQGDGYYDLPNVPYVMFYEGENLSRSAGFSIHGAYWHNNFGHPMSHGCINMRETDVEKLYNWANPVTEGNTTYSSSDNTGTKVTVYGEAQL